MWIVAGGTVSHHPFTGPVCLAFAVSTAQPVTLWPEMALPAKLVAVIKINFPPLLINQGVAICGVMTINACQFAVPYAMVDGNISMGEESSASDLHRLVAMANAARVTAYGILAGKHFEGASLVVFFGDYLLHRQLMG